MRTVTRPGPHPISFVKMQSVPLHSIADDFQRCDYGNSGASESMLNAVTVPF
jgi:hypothetical protein